MTCCLLFLQPTRPTSLRKCVDVGPDRGFWLPFDVKGDVDVTMSMAIQRSDKPILHEGICFILSSHRLVTLLCENPGVTVLHAWQ